MATPPPIFLMLTDDGPVVFENSSQNRVVAIAGSL